VFTVGAGAASIYSIIPRSWGAQPRPKLHIAKFELMRQKDSGAPGVNVFFRIEGAAAVVSDGLSRLVVTNFPGDDKEVALEDSLFNGMLSELGPDRSLGDMPVGKESYVTLIGKSLPEDVWTKVRGKLAAVYFMGRFKYSDDQDAYHSDYCGFSMGDPPAQFLCHHHNEEP
jgi:hypothetical protein